MRRDLWVDGLISIFLIIPFLVTTYLPLTDLPNHLARQHILVEWATSPELQKYYYYKFSLVPNLALDLLVPLMSNVMPVDVAIRVFCTLALLSIFWGCRMLNRQLAGAEACAYRFVPFLCYGGPLQYGFLDFCFGIGLALVMLGMYLRLRDAPPYTLLAIFLPCGFVLLLCHLAAFGLWAVSIGAFELVHPFGRLPKTEFREVALEIVRRELRAGLFLLPPFIVFLVFSPTTIGSHLARWSTFHEKLEGIAAITMFASPRLELFLLALAMAGFAVALIVGAVRVRRESVAILAVMAAIYLLLPRVALGGGYVDYRVPWAGSFFLLAGLTPGRSAARSDRAVGVWFGGLAVARIVLITTLWLNWDPVIAGVVTALRDLPRGARLMVVLGDPGSTTAARSPSLEHVAAYAVAYRQAYWAGMFADIAGQILFFQPAYKHDWTDSMLHDELRQLDPMYQYVLVLRPDFAHVSPKLNLHCVADGNDFQLFAVATDAEGEQRRVCSQTGAR
jgi:hypothetical protein